MAGCIRTSTVERPATLTETARYPTNEKVSTAFAGTVSVYLPLASVTVRISVPGTRTPTPCRRCPSTEVTVPDTGTCWPIAVPHNTSVHSKLIPTSRREERRAFHDDPIPCSMFSMANLPMELGAHLILRVVTRPPALCCPV